MFDHDAVNIHQLGAVAEVDAKLVGRSCKRILTLLGVNPDEFGDPIFW